MEETYGIIGRTQRREIMGEWDHRHFRRKDYVIEFDWRFTIFDES